MPAALVHVERPEDAWLAPRTARSLAAAGFAARVVDRLAELEGGCLLARAGAWLLEPGPVRLPGGSRWIGIGIPVDGRWGDLRRRCGGDLERLRWPWRRLPEVPPFVWLPAPAAAELREELARRGSLLDALHGLLLGGRYRAVCLPGLDGRRDPRPRLVQAVTSIHIGGAERIAVESSRGLGDRGWPSLLASLGQPQRAELPRPRCFADLAGAADKAAALDEAALRFGADLIHAHLLRGDQVRELSRRGWPVVVTLHNTHHAWPRGTAELAAAEVALVVACSRAVAADGERCELSPPVRTVWNGVEPGPLRSAAPVTPYRQRLGLPPGALVLLALANVRAQKRFDRLASIVAACRALRQDVYLLAAGEGTLELPAAPGCYCLGLVEDPKPLIAECDVLVCPSDHEGLSLAQLEVLAAGKRVVATDVGGAREVPGVRLVPADATDEEVAGAILDEGRAAAGPGLAASFRREAMLSRLSWLYPRALERHRRGGPPRGSDLWLVTNNFSTGGAQTSARRLLLGLRDRGHRVHAAVLEEGGRRRSPGLEALARAGIDVFAPPTDGFRDAEEVCARLLQAMDASPPRTVVFWNAIASAKVLLADALLDTRVIDVSPGDMWYASFERYFARPRTCLPYRSPLEYGRLLAGAVVKYAADRERAERTLGCPVHVIPNGVPLAGTGRRERNGVLVLGTAARLSPDKRLGDVLDGVRAAHARLPRYELWIAGGPDGAGPAHARELRRQARGLPVRWLGETAGAGALLERADLFLMISEPAGCPNASLEALASGVPVLATDHGGAAEQVVDGITGRLVPRRDPGAFAQALVELAADPPRLATLGAAARRHAAERFSMEAMVERYESVLWPGGP